MRTLEIRPITKVAQLYTKHLNFAARVGIQSSPKKNYNTAIDKTSTKIICPFFRLKYHTPRQQKHNNIIL